MATHELKTNIKCSGCVAAVTPFLDETVGAGQWKVDTANPAKVLTVQSDKGIEAIVDAVQKAGYKAEKLA